MDQTKIFQRTKTSIRINTAAELVVQIICINVNDLAGGSSSDQCLATVLDTLPQRFSQTSYSMLFTLSHLSLAN